MKHAQQMTLWDELDALPDLEDLEEIPEGGALPRFNENDIIVVAIDRWADGDRSPEALARLAEVMLNSREIWAYTNDGKMVAGMSMWQCIATGVEDDRVLCAYRYAGLWSCYHYPIKGWTLDDLDFW